LALLAVSLKSGNFVDNQRPVTQTLAPRLTLPSTPRPITRLVTRRSWREAPVQSRLKLAGVVVLVGAFVTAMNLKLAIKDRRLQQHGITTTAKLVRVGGVSEKENRNWKMLRDQTIEVELLVIMPDGRLLTLKGPLPPGNGYLAVNGDITVRVDPDDPNNWTEAVEIQSWWHVLAVPLFFMLPVLVILLAIAEWRRRRVLAVWRDGVRAYGVVIDIKQTAAAPLSRIVRFTIVDGPDKRVLTSLYPSGVTVPKPGDTLNIIVPQDRPDETIVADLYARPGDAPQQPAE
jgi:hypothetical protein